MRIGDIWRVHTALARPPKVKIVLCIGHHFGRHLFLWFNTEERLRPAQMSVGANDAPGITRDCFLDCGRTTTFPDHELAKAQHCGVASAAFLTKVAEEVRERAATLPTRHRNAIVAALTDHANENELP